MFFFGGEVSENAGNSLAPAASIGDGQSVRSEPLALANIALGGTVSEEGTDNPPSHGKLSAAGVRRLDLASSHTSRAILPVFRLPSVHKGSRTRVTKRQRREGDTEGGIKLAWTGGLAGSFTESKGTLSRSTGAGTRLGAREESARREEYAQSQSRVGLRAGAAVRKHRAGGRKSGKRRERGRRPGAGGAPPTLRLSESAPPYSDAFHTRSTPRCLRSKGDASPAELRHELSAAIRTVQDLTNRVRQDIANVHKLCPITNLRAQLYMQKWGIEMFERIFLKLKHGKLQSAFARWQSWIKYSTQVELLHAVKLKEGANLVAKTILNWDHHAQEAAFGKWKKAAIHARIAEVREREASAARVLQRRYRVYQAKQRVDHLRANLRRAKANTAATRIQASWRGYRPRAHLREVRREQQRESSAKVIQCMVRLWKANRVLVAARSMMRKNRAAGVIQCAWRGKQSRDLLTTTRLLRRRVEAVKRIQSLVRGRRGRVRFLRVLARERERRSATKIQALYRGSTGRKLATEELRRHVLHEKKKKLAAIRIQAVYRAHRDRLSYLLQSQVTRMLNMERSRAAKKIQSIYRGRLARKRVGDLKGENMEEMISLARIWTEMWDEDNEQWFYFNEETQEAAWEPPAIGYTKNDGKLVIRTGDVIADVSVCGVCVCVCVCCVYVCVCVCV